MDFTFTPEQDDAAELAARIVGDRTGPDRLKAVEAAAHDPSVDPSGDTGRLDRDLWRELGAAGLLSLHLPEAYGGTGLGLVELARVLVELGRRVAPVPLAVHGPAGLLVAEAGSTDQRERWLPGLASGERIATAAVAEDLTHLPERPTTTAVEGPDGVTLAGTKTLVRAGMAADLLLVTATAAGASGAGVYLVDVDSPGVVRRPQHTSDGDTTALVELTDAPATRLGDEAAATRFGRLLTACAAAEQLGVTEGALALTSAYAKTREQFGRPIATFQAVSQRLADGFIDVLAQRLTLWQAVWRLGEGLPADVEVATAKLWAADAGHRLAHTTVHVHGGVGIDLDGEAHRYFTAAKRFEFLFGGATEQAALIGRALAAGA